MQLANKAVLNTGGGKGIGLAITQAFARGQNRVLICGREEAHLAAALNHGYAAMSPGGRYHGRNR